MIVVTGATGQLGQLVIESLLKTVPANQIVAAVRTPSKAAALAARGVQVRQADYSKPETLDAAFAGATKLLLISSSEVGQRAAQHKAVVEAAVRAKVKLIAYTSLLRADTTVLGLATEHVETENMIKASGLPYTFLRNGWYTENYAASIPAALAHNATMGSAGDGRISSAARADYADAAAVVLSTDGHAGKIYELAGDTSYTLAEFAAEIGRQAGKTITYSNLPQADYKAALLGFGLPEFLAELLADSDAGAAKGGLFDDGKTLSRLIGRPTTALSVVVGSAVAAAKA